MNLSRIARAATLAGGAMLAVLGSGALAGTAQAQGRLEAQYVATLGGIPIGRGHWAVDVTDEHFSAVASGATSGFMRIFASGQGSSASRGAVLNGQPSASSFASSIVTDKKLDEVRMSLSGGNVKEYVAEPPQPPTPDRIPINESHRRGITDPMTASLVRVPGNGDVLVPEACQRTVAIFDGRMRYDLQFAYRRIERVKSEKGYQGPVVVCGVHFQPIAGHVPDRSAIKYLVALHDIEVWLAPLAGTRLVVPYRVSIPTPIGTGVLQATEFNTFPIAARSTASSTKTQ